MNIVVVEDGAHSRLRFSGPTVSVGRALDNDIRLSGSLASRHHCRLEREGADVWVVDLGSSNGTQVNGERVSRVRLGPGDVVGIGEARLEVDLGDPRGQSADAQGGYATLEVGRSTSQSEEAGLRAFAAITRALAQETDLERLLRRVVDSAVALVGAERGFLLLAERDVPGSTGAPQQMKVRVARAFDQSDIPLPDSRLSMGIARRVLEEGRSLLSVDAGRDERFVGMASVEDLRLRSVMAVPIEIDGAPEAILVVDNRLQRGAFGEKQLELVELFAGQGAIAIRNARFLRQLHERNERLARSAEQIRSLNEKLGRKVRDRDSELAVVRAELGRERGRYDYSNIVGASDGIKRIFHELDRVVETQLPVLIQGESGTGKELIARAVHFNGPRKERPFVVENCAALPDTLLESELFGHTRGAFTGADRAKKGLFEQADGGTLFLDEIGDMSAEMQKKLLRVLQEGEVRPLGSATPVAVDVRLVAASHQDLEAMVKEGRFREDLFYRVNVLTLRLPALRQRRDDVPVLAEALLARAAREAGKPVPSLSHEVLACLSAYDWPGNVRELENEMRRVVLLAEEVVALENLSETVRSGGGAGSGAEATIVPDAPLGDLRGAVARFEKRAIATALAQAENNKSRAAKDLGISRFALQRKMEKYGIVARPDAERGDDGDDGEEREGAR